MAPVSDVRMWVQSNWWWVWFLGKLANIINGRARSWTKYPDNVFMNNRSVIT
jgi:hypothetical protein